MAYPNQVPRVDEIVTPGVLYLAGARPTAYSFVQSRGRYADVIVGWKAQARMAIAYLADQVVSARLGSAAQPMATGDALTQLCRSEFETDRETGSVAAVGQFYMARSLTAPGGAIPAGFRFRRDADTSATPQVPAAIYTATRNVPLGYGRDRLFSVPVVASKAGAASNAPVFTDSTGTYALGFGKVSMVDVPYEPSIVLLNSPIPYEASGGLDSESDADLIAQATAYAAGQYGPTVGAILAGALRGTGAHRVLVRDIYNWTDTGAVAATTGVCLADASWAAGPTWISQVQQSIADNFQGFGQSIIVSGVTNVPIRVDCLVTLRDANSLSFTDAILIAIQNAVRSYFDDRPDWFTFRGTGGPGTPPGGLRAAIGAADRRILSCTSAIVYRVSDNAVVAQPVATPAANHGTGLVCTHWALIQNGVNATFSGPT